MWALSATAVYLLLRWDGIEDDVRTVKHAIDTFVIPAVLSVGREVSELLGCSKRPAPGTVPPMTVRRPRTAEPSNSESLESDDE